MNTRSLLTLLPSASDYRGLRRARRGDLLAGVTVGTAVAHARSHIGRAA